MEFHFRFSPIIPYYVLVLVGEKKVSMQSLESPTGHLQFLSNPPFANGWSQYAAWWAWNNSPPEPGHSLQKPPNRAIAVTSSKLSPQIGGPLSLCCLWKLNRTDKRCTLVAEGPSQPNVHWHFWAKSRPWRLMNCENKMEGPTETWANSPFRGGPCLLIKVGTASPTDNCAYCEGSQDRGTASIGRPDLRICSASSSVFEHDSQNFP